MPVYRMKPRQLYSVKNGEDSGDIADLARPLLYETIRVWCGSSREEFSTETRSGNSMLSYQDGFDQVNQALQKCLTDAEADTIFLCERSGSVIAMESNSDMGAADNVAALAAGAFFASREIARMLGEDEFNTVSQRGKKVGLLVQAIDGDFLLMVVYGNKTNQGLVKHYTGLTQQRVQNLFEACPDLKNPVRLVSGTPFELNFEAEVYKRA